MFPFIAIRLCFISLSRKGLYSGIHLWLESLSGTRTLCFKFFPRIKWDTILNGWWLLICEWLSYYQLGITCKVFYFVIFQVSAARYTISFPIIMLIHRRGKSLATLLRVYEDFNIAWSSNILETCYKNVTINFKRRIFFHICFFFKPYHNPNVYQLVSSSVRSTNLFSSTGG